MTRLLPIAEDGVRRALARGAESAEVYVTRSQLFRVAAAGRYARTAVRGEDGVAVRLVAGGRTGSGAAQSVAEIDRAIEEALGATRRAGSPAAVPFPVSRPPLHEAPGVPLREGAGEAGLTLAERIVADALERKLVDYVQVTVVDHGRRLAVANSHGLGIEETSSAASLEVELRVTDGVARRTTRETVMESPHDVAVPALLDRLVDNAAQALHPRPLPEGRAAEVILHPAPAAQLLRLLGSAFSGLALQAGSSPLAKAHGERVFQERVSIHDDPRGRRLYDDEGTPTRLHPLVERGVVVGALHDARTAAAMRTEPTGHGYRAGLSGGVAPRPSRLVLQGGDLALDELVAGAQRAVLVTEPLLGSFVSDKLTADFSVVAPFAFYVENGRIAHALPPTTIGGNVHAVFADVLGLGRDARTCAAARAPAMRAGGVTCAT